MNRIIASLCLLITISCSNKEKNPKVESMNTNSIEVSVGQYIVAQPNFPSPVFENAIILVTQTSEEFITGIRINSPGGVSLEELSTKYQGHKSIVTVGGPVQRNESILQIHTLGQLMSNSKEILPGLYFMGKLSDIEDRLKSDEFNETSIRLFTGYTSWNRKQFAEEFKEGVWFISNANINEVMTSNTSNLWKELIERNK